MYTDVLKDASPSKSVTALFQLSMVFGEDVSEKPLEYSTSLKLRDWRHGSILLRWAEAGRGRSVNLFRS
jgi:hypothetical protein